MVQFRLCRLHTLAVLRLGSFFCGELRPSHLPYDGQTHLNHALHAVGRKHGFKIAMIQVAVKFFPYVMFRT
jgi:hypothetical protein